MLRLPLDFTLATERLTLRLPSEADIPHVWSASRVPGFTDGMLWNPPDHPDELRAPLARAIESWRAATAYQFSIDHGAEFVGRIALRPLQEPVAPEDLGPATRPLDVGFWTHPDHQGHGYMTEALSALADLAFTTMDADALVAYHCLWNDASRRVLEKAGFRRIRVFPGGFVKNGVATDDALMRLDRRDPLGHAATHDAR